MAASYKRCKKLSGDDKLRYFEISWLNLQNTMAKMVHVAFITKILKKNGFISGFVFTGKFKLRLLNIQRSVAQFTLRTSLSHTESVSQQKVTAESRSCEIQNSMGVFNDLCSAGLRNDLRL